MHRVLLHAVWCSRQTRLSILLLLGGLAVSISLLGSGSTVARLAVCGGRLTVGGIDHAGSWSTSRVLIGILLPWLLRRLLLGRILLLIPTHRYLRCLLRLEVGVWHLGGRRAGLGQQAAPVERVSKQVRCDVDK